VLRRLGILTPADAAFFVAYCEAAATYGRANAKLREQGKADELIGTGWFIADPTSRPSIHNPKKMIGEHN